MAPSSKEGVGFIDISGMLESEEFIEKLADSDDSKLSHR
jgi:hypothetical protein